MREQASLINQKFVVEIRRRQRQDIIKAKRQIIMQNCIQKIDNQDSKVLSIQNGIIKGTQTTAISFSNLQQLKQIFISENMNFLEQINLQTLQKALAIILTKQSLQSIEAANLLASFIQFCWGQRGESKKICILQALRQAKIQETILELAYKSFNQINSNKLQIYLFCLRNMALCDMQELRNPKLIQKYLPILLEPLISNPLVLTVISYVSQVTALRPGLVKMICEQASSKEKVIRVYTLYILNNYLAVENNQKNIEALFQQILQTLIHLYMHCKPYGAKFGVLAFGCMKELIEGHPSSKSKEMLSKIERVKLHDVLMTMLRISGDQVKLMVYQLQQVIIDKTIHELGHQFFQIYNEQMMDQFSLGIQTTNNQIITRCLKILIKLVQYASAQAIKKMNTEFDLNYILDDLTYHKNQYISKSAQILKNMILEGQQSGMSDQ